MVRQWKVKNEFAGKMSRKGAYSLCFPFVRALVLVVDAAEIRNDYRYGQGDHEHATERAHAANDLPRYSFGHHVTIPATIGTGGVLSAAKRKTCSSLPKRGHGDDGVPESGGYRSKNSLIFVLLRVEHDRREDDDGHGQGEDKEAEFGSARL